MNASESWIYDEALRPVAGESHATLVGAPFSGGLQEFSYESLIAEPGIDI